MGKGFAQCKKVSQWQSRLRHTKKIPLWLSVSTCYYDKGFSSKYIGCHGDYIKPLIPALLVLTEQCMGCFTCRKLGTEVDKGVKNCLSVAAQLLLIIISQDINLLNWH